MDPASIAQPAPITVGSGDVAWTFVTPLSADRGSRLLALRTDVVEGTTRTFDGPTWSQRSLVYGVRIDDGADVVVAVESAARDSLEWSWLHFNPDGAIRQMALPDVPMLIWDEWVPVASGFVGLGRDDSGDQHIVHVTSAVTEDAIVRADPAEASIVAIDATGIDDVVYSVAAVETGSGYSTPLAGVISVDGWPPVVRWAPIELDLSGGGVLGDMRISATQAGAVVAVKRRDVSGVPDQEVLHMVWVDPGLDQLGEWLGDAAGPFAWVEAFGDPINGVVITSPLSDRVPATNAVMYARSPAPGELTTPRHVTDLTYVWDRPPSGWRTTGGGDAIAVVEYDAEIFVFCERTP